VLHLRLLLRKKSSSQLIKEIKAYKLNEKGFISHFGDF